MCVSVCVCGVCVHAHTFCSVSQHGHTTISLGILAVRPTLSMLSIPPTPQRASLHTPFCLPVAVAGGKDAFPTRPRVHFELTSNNTQPTSVCGLRPFSSLNGWLSRFLTDLKASCQLGLLCPLCNSLRIHTGSVHA